MITPSVILVASLICFLAAMVLWAWALTDENRHRRSERARRQRVHDVWG